MKLPEKMFVRRAVLAYNIIWCKLLAVYAGGLLAQRHIPDIQCMTIVVYTMFNSFTAKIHLILPNHLAHPGRDHAIFCQLPISSENPTNVPQFMNI